MVKMNKLNPIHNQVEPPIASMKAIKIASGSHLSKSSKPRMNANERRSAGEF
jgi:hypothetical protein